jgi:hypothetical protein
MRLLDLFENAKDDIGYNKQAKEFVSKIVKIFLNEDAAYYGYGMKLLRIDGKIYATLDIDDIKVMFLRGPNFYTVGGAFSKFQNSKQPVIIVKLLGDPFRTGLDLETLAKEVVHDNKIHRVLEHEYIHYLDSFRIPNMLDAKSNSSEQSDGELPKRNDDKYYNDPVEFNAYYHNSVSHLMAFINAAKKGDPDRLAKIFGITDNFKNTMEKVLSKNGYHENDFLKTLNSRNKKAFYKRLYGLWVEAMKLINGDLTEEASLGGTCSGNVASIAAPMGVILRRPPYGENIITKKSKKKINK